jgi:hypothetical protein
MTLPHAQRPHSKGSAMLSDLAQSIWEALMDSTWARRITFAVLLMAILYFWGLNWSAIGIWAAIFALNEGLAFLAMLAKWWRGRRGTG